MTKYISLISTFLFMTTVAGANFKQQAINTNLIDRTDALIVGFDGEVFRNTQGSLMLEPDIQKYLGNGKKGSYSYRNGTKLLELRDTNQKFILSSQIEEFDGKAGLRVSQSQAKKRADGKSDLIHSSITFDGDYVRSISECRGDREVVPHITGKAKYGDSDREITYCVVYTPKVCQKVLNAYNIKALTDAKLDSADKMKKKVAECTSIMESYSQILKGFAESETDLAKEDEKIIDSELEKIRDQVGLVKERTMNRSATNLSLNKSEDFGKLKELLTSSARGLSQISKMVEVCENNLPFFNDTKYSKFDPVPGKTQEKHVK